MIVCVITVVGLMKYEAKRMAFKKEKNSIFGQTQVEEKKILY